MRARPLVVATMLLAGAAADAGAQSAPEAQNMRLVGQHDLQARSAYQPLVHKQGDRFIAYVGHHGGLKRNALTGQDEQNGTSILDVTDPRAPRDRANTGLHIVEFTGELR